MIRVTRGSFHTRLGQQHDAIPLNSRSKLQTIMGKKNTEIAVSAAIDELKKDSAAWITESALRERAYRLGLYHGLSAISDDEYLEHFLARTYIDTMFPRSADDPFTASDVGKLFASMKDRFLNRGPDEDSGLDLDSDLKKMVSILEDSLIEREQDVQRNVGMIRDLLKDLLSMKGEDFRRDQHSLLDHLESSLRNISCTDKNAC